MGQSRKRAETERRAGGNESPVQAAVEKAVTPERASIDTDNAVMDQLAELREYMERVDAHSHAQDRPSRPMRVVSRACNSKRLCARSG